MKEIASLPATGVRYSIRKELFDDYDSDPVYSVDVARSSVSANDVSGQTTQALRQPEIVLRGVDSSVTGEVCHSVRTMANAAAGTLSVVRAPAASNFEIRSQAVVSRGSAYVAPLPAMAAHAETITVAAAVPEEPVYNVASAPGDVVLLPYEMPRAEYMYGCTATAIAMIMAYYDRNGYTVNGQRYSAVNLIKGGQAELNSRGLDGNIYNMNSFDTLVGKATASHRHVAEFFGETTTPDMELKYTFVGDTNVIDQSRWDCLADYMGTNQFWRGNDDFSSLVFFNQTLGEIKQNPGTFDITYGDVTRTQPYRWMDHAYGISLYVDAMGGYRLHDTMTASYKTDNAGGIFTFEMYKAEIDAGRAVHIGIEGHSMVGYGYDSAKREIIFDDTYESGKRMKWGGSYYYSSANRKLLTISTLAFDVNYFKALPTITGSLVYQQTRKSASSKLENLTASAQKTPTDKILYQVSSVTGGVLYLDVNGNNVFDENELSLTNGRFYQSDIDAGTFKFNFADGSKAGSLTFQVANGSDGDTGQYLWSNQFQYQIFAKKNPDPVTIHAPAINGDSVTLTWDVQAGLKYEVQYALTQDFSIFTQTTLTVGEWDLQLADNLYYWRVRAVDSDKDASEWMGAQFRIDTVAPDVPVALLPELNGSDALFRWSPVSDASKVFYQLEWSVNADFSGAQSRIVTDTSYLAQGLTDGVYYWRLHAYDAAGNVGAMNPGGSFRVDTLAPEVVAVAEPKLYGTRVEFAWSEVTDVSGVRYELEYATDAEFRDAVKVVQEKTKFAVNDIPEGQYYWRVRAVDGAGNAQLWSTGTTFLVDTIAPLVGQIDAPQYSEEEIVWTWGAALDAGGLAYYELEYAATSDFADSVKLQLSANSYKLADPESQRYFWRVRAADNAGNISRWQMGTPFRLIGESGSDFADAQEITFNRVHEERLGGDDLVDMFKITLTAGQYSIMANGVDAPLRAQVALYDAGGKKVLLRGDSKRSGFVQTSKVILDAGTYYIKVNSADHGKSSGLYGIKVEGNTFDLANQADDDGARSAPLVQVPGDRAELAPLALMAGEWVGTGDIRDYRRIDVACAGKYDFTLLNLRNTAKLTVYNAANKKVKSITVKADSSKNVIADLLLTAGRWYVGVEAPGAKKAENTGYDLQISGEVFNRGNRSDDTAATATALNPALGVQGEWVGFGDAVDYYAFEVTAATAGRYGFSLTGEAKMANITVYLDRPGKSAKQLKRAVIGKTGVASINNLQLNEGRYLLAVASADKGKGKKNTSYDLSLQLPEVTAALQLPRSAVQMASLPDLSADGLGRSWDLNAALAPELACAVDALTPGEDERKHAGLLASA